MDYLIIGSGVAGISAVKELVKERSADDNITVITKESYPFYYRPRLINCLSGNIDVEDIIINDFEWFDENDIDLRIDERVHTVDPDEKNVETNKNKYSYDKLLLANGAHSFVPPIEGREKENIFTLRNAKEAKEIHKKASEKDRAVVIGGGLLGLESAYNLQQAGLEVTIVEMADHCLARQLDFRGGQLLQKKLEDKGLNFILNGQTVRFSGENTVKAVHLKDGREIETDMVLISAGIRSNIELVEDTPIETNKGITVNNFMETNIADIYAAGDVAEHDGRVYGIWAPSMEQGAVAGKNMIGIKDKFEGYVSSYSLKVVGVDVVSIGKIEAEDLDCKEELEEDEDSYKKIIKKDEVPIGAIMIGDTSGKKELVKRIEEAPETQ